jgi:hypothetical protein
MGVVVEIEKDADVFPSVRKQESMPFPAAAPCAGVTS